MGLLPRGKQQALAAQRSSHKDKDAAHAQNRATCLGCTHLRAISRILDSLRPSVPWGDTGTIPRPIAMRKQACFPEGICELDCDTLNEPGSGSACFYINLTRSTSQVLVVLVSTSTYRQCSARLITQYTVIHDDTNGYK